MAGHEGNKRAIFLFRSDKFLVGVYIPMATTCIILFLVTLVFLAKFEGSVVMEPASGAHQSQSELSKSLEELKNDKIQSQNETKDKFTELEKRLMEYWNKAEKDFLSYEKKIAELEYEMGKERRARLLGDGFESLSNGLLFKFFGTVTKYEDAKARCSNLGTTLAVESIRNETLRRELHTKVTYYIWIGLEDSVETKAWVWSDGKIFKYGDTSSTNFTHSADGLGYAAVRSKDKKFYKLEKHTKYRYICEANF